MATYNPNNAVSSPQFVTGTPDWVKPIVEQAIAKFPNVSPMVLTALLKQESGFNPNAKSPVGAIGIAQFMPATAQGRGVNPLDPTSSIMGAAAYLSEALNRYGGDIKKALASYNAGYGNVDAFGGVPPFQETQNYVKNILAMSGSPHQSFAGPMLDLINSYKEPSSAKLTANPGSTFKANNGLSSKPMAFNNPSVPNNFNVSLPSLNRPSMSGLSNAFNTPQSNYPPPPQQPQQSSTPSSTSSSTTPSTPAPTTNFAQNYINNPTTAPNQQGYVG